MGWASACCVPRSAKPQRAALCSAAGPLVRHCCRPHLCTCTPAAAAAAVGLAGGLRCPSAEGGRAHLELLIDSWRQRQAPPTRLPLATSLAQPHPAPPHTVSPASCPSAVSRPPLQFWRSLGCRTSRRCCPSARCASAWRQRTCCAPSCRRWASAAHSWRRCYPCMHGAALDAPACQPALMPELLHGLPCSA